MPRSEGEIAIAVPLGVPHLERVVHGVRAYAQEKTDWRFLLSPETHRLAPVALKDWKGQGVIAIVNTQEDLEVLQSLDCPVVNVSGALREAPFPRVRPDYANIGRNCAEFLLTKGFKRFAYYGLKGVWYSTLYERGFREAIERQGGRCDILRAEATLRGQYWDSGRDQLEAWLKELETPTAVLAAHDPRAAMVIRACERVGLRVPQDVAVLGVNDDNTTCEFCRPTLSSMDRSGIDIGYRAAELLDGLNTGRFKRGEAYEIVVPTPNDKVVERQSTNTLVLDDVDLAEAVRFMEQHYEELIGVDQVVEANRKSRRWLEKAFRSQLGFSPRDFLFQLRIKKAQALLRAGERISLNRLARSCGFSGTRQLNTHFRQATGHSVQEYIKHGGDVR